mmetsp:Transcript_5967/g.9526  ORF Transcript_5967/g.9526 Transcript_5967/m.9526 type:complete len:370 (-) Transcript_5967:239-1348(-)
MAQEHQEYIQQKVNPVLENLVTQLLLERPEQLAPFMIKWLSQNSKTPAAAALTEGVNVLTELKGEMERLQEEVSLLETKVAEKKTRGKDADGEDKEQDAPPKKKAKDAGDDSEEEEEDDDDEDDFLPPPAAYVNAGQRASVSAEAYGQFNQVREFTAPVYPKTDEQKNRIQTVLKESFLFSALEARDINVIIDAMQEKICEKDERLINQGDDGDCLYVVEEGEMDCFKKQPDGTEKKVKECKAGDAFGELALMYNTPRAASVVAQDRCVLWQLDRESFNHIVKQAAAKRRERYEEFLKSVPILQSMETEHLEIRPTSEIPCVMLFSHTRLLREKSSSSRVILETCSTSLRRVRLFARRSTWRALPPRRS